MNYNEIGIQALQEGNTEEAIQAFTKAIEEQPEDSLGYINFGHVLTSMDEIDRAERFFQKAIVLMKHRRRLITASPICISIQSAMKKR